MRMRARLKAARVAKGWSRLEAANRAGISKRTWEAYELGYRTPRMHLMERISDLLDQPLDIWRDNTSDMPCEEVS